MKEKLGTILRITPNMPDYDAFCGQFSWEREYESLDGLPEGGINIAHEAVDRHANSDRGNTVALRWVRKDKSFEDFS